MKFLRKSQSKSIYDDFFHNAISQLENIRLMFSTFNLFVPLLPKQQTTENSFSVVTETFCNKSKQFFGGLTLIESFFSFFFLVIVKCRDSVPLRAYNIGYYKNIPNNFLITSFYEFYNIHQL